MLTVSYSKHLYKFNNSTNLYGSIGYSTLSQKDNPTGQGFALLININLLIGEINCLEISAGYSYFYQIGHKYLPDKPDYKISSNFLNLELAYRHQYKFPRSKIPLITGFMTKYGVSTLYNLSDNTLFNNKFILFFFVGLEVSL